MKLVLFGWGLGVLMMVLIYIVEAGLTVRLFTPTKIGNIQFRMVVWGLRVMGMSRLMSKELRALRLLVLAIRYARASGVALHSANTALALRYSEPVEQPEPILAELGVALVLAAHTRSVRVGDNLLKSVEQMEANL